MRLVFIRKDRLQCIIMLSITVVVLNLLSMHYLANIDIEQIDLSLLSGHRIVLDAGHGGIDSGACANQVIEKEITLAIVLKLADILQNNGAIVAFTRETDLDYYTRGKGGKRNDLLKRIEIMENSTSEIFISVHCNAFRDAKFTGAQVFYNPKVMQNKIVAETLQRALKEFPEGNKRQAKEDLHILLLNSINHIPGVLIETGYLTNKQEATLLANDGYQQKLAEQIAKGLAYYFRQDVTK